MKRKPSKKQSSKPKTTLFWRIQLGHMFEFNGAEYRKYSPRAGITERGEVIRIPDAQQVIDLQRQG